MGNSIKPTEHKIVAVLEWCGRCWRDAVEWCKAYRRWLAFTVGASLLMWCFGNVFGQQPTARRSSGPRPDCYSFETPSMTGAPQWRFASKVIEDRKGAIGRTVVYIDADTGYEVVVDFLPGTAKHTPPEVKEREKQEAKAK